MTSRMTQRILHR